MAEKRAGKTGSKLKDDADISAGSEQTKESEEPLKTLTSFFTVEPIMLIQMSTAILAFMAVQDFLFEKACKANFGYSDAVCTALKSG